MARMGSGGYRADNRRIKGGGRCTESSVNIGQESCPMRLIMGQSHSDSIYSMDVSCTMKRMAPSHGFVCWLVAFGHFLSCVLKSSEGSAPCPLSLAKCLLVSAPPRPLFSERGGSAPFGGIEYLIPKFKTYLNAWALPWRHGKVIAAARLAGAGLAALTLMPSLDATMPWLKSAFAITLMPFAVSDLMILQ